MKLIGIEEHYLTADVRNAWEAIGLSATDPSVAVHSGEIERRLLDLADERLALMDETGLDVQVPSLTTPALRSGAGRHRSRPSRPRCGRGGDRAPARSLPGSCRLAGGRPGCGGAGIGTLRSHARLRSTILCGRVGNRNLVHPDLKPIFEAASALQVPVLLHPRTPPLAVRSVYYSGLTPEVDTAFSMYGLGWHYDARIQFIRLILSRRI